MEISVSGCSGDNLTEDHDEVLKENVMLSLRMELPSVIPVVVSFAAQMILKTIVTGFAKNMTVSMEYVQLLTATSLFRCGLLDHSQRHAASQSTRKWKDSILRRVRLLSHLWNAFKNGLHHVIQPT
jgi:uncharacterized membrane protein